MRRVLVAAGALWALTFTTVPAAAQERGQAGVAMGYPASVAIVWHATDRIALRPEVSFSVGSSETISILGIQGVTLREVKSSSDSLGLGVGLGALFYVTRSDNLSTYFAPRVSFSRTRTETETEYPPSIIFVGPNPGSETTTTAWSFSGSFGAQYALSRRFSVFGELGLAYGDTHTESGTLRAESNGWALSNRASAGIILYF